MRLRRAPAELSTCFLTRMHSSFASPSLYSAYARVLEHGRHGRLAKLAAAAFSPPRAPLSPTVCANTFPVVRRPFGSPFPASTAAVAPSPPEQPSALRLLAWPAGHKPPQAKLGSPEGAHGPMVPPRHFPLRRRGSSGRQTAGSCEAPSKIVSRDLGFKFEFWEGPFCEPVDSDE